MFPYKVGGSRKGPKHAYVIYEWSLSYEKKRIGGDWVVAQAVPTRKLRDVIRKNFGDDKVFFFLLRVEKEVTLERFRPCPSSVIFICGCHPWIRVIHLWMTSTNDNSIHG